MEPLGTDAAGADAFAAAVAATGSGFEVPERVAGPTLVVAVGEEGLERADMALVVETGGRFADAAVLEIVGGRAEGAVAAIKLAGLLELAPTVRPKGRA